jgi:hypothetical protein
MERSETDPRKGGSEPPRPDEALRRLEQRLDQASDVAERLIAQATGEAARVGARLKPPPRGWQLREEPAGAQPTAETDPLLQVLHALRDLVPSDLQRRIAEAVRELLLALRALIDWYLERIEQRRRAPVEVQDIPVL